ncbi:MAG: hypothetical protein NXY57DRAFT_1043533 [Lentinula lateritia]|uniref:Uncharacterized protein n=1 Tax=Lentinula lateritia TaxID=40482 RepID=A0ABQ8V5D3_9AGAR|nr:MAG: hypothetical protein NXY57DRAFT_1043533 [Lentinula lateritia]KAJ4473950.1 hypothetical protein C8R41DRAFT_870204 [Lentinula lateritia]
MPWRQSEASKHVSCCEDESPNDNILEGVPGVFQLLLSDGDEVASGDESTKSSDKKGEGNSRRVDDWLVELEIAELNCKTGGNPRWERYIGDGQAVGDGETLCGRRAFSVQGRYADPGSWPVRKLTKILSIRSNVLNGYHRTLVEELYEDLSNLSPLNLRGIVALSTANMPQESSNPRYMEALKRRVWNDQWAATGRKHQLVHKEHYFKEDKRTRRLIRRSWYYHIKGFRRSRR